MSPSLGKGRRSALTVVAKISWSIMISSCCAPFDDYRLGDRRMRQPAAADNPAKRGQTDAENAPISAAGPIAPPGRQATMAIAGAARNLASKSLAGIGRPKK